MAFKGFAREDVWAGAFTFVSTSRTRNDNQVNPTSHMKPLLHVDLTFDQVLDIVKQLPPQQKLLLTEALEKEAVDNRLSRLLQSFRTDELDWDTLTQEVESVRQELYEKQSC